MKKIFCSNSRGELFHLYDYIQIAEVINNDNDWFKNWFDFIVEYAENNWNRPESIFQHIFTMLVQCLPEN